MRLSEEKWIAAPPAQVYAALNDTAVLQQCIPGCSSLERKSDNELAATISLKIGPVSANFSGEVTLSNLNPPHGYTISGQGSGNAGFARGQADVQLAEKDNGTLLNYTVQADISGKIAQLGARLIDSTAKKLANQFFTSFAQTLAPESESVEATESESAPVSALTPRTMAIAAAVVLLAVLALAAAL